MARVCVGSLFVIFLTMQTDLAKENISGFAYLLQRLDIQSGVGRELLSRSHWYARGEEAELLNELVRIDRLKALLLEKQDLVLEKLRRKFSQVLDIRGTFGLIGKADVDDVQLFEVKRFSLLVRDCSSLIAELIRICAFHPAPANFPDLAAVISILDPRGENLPTFYIYDEYSEPLAQKRRQIDALSANNADGSKMQEIAVLQEECAGLEQQIRVELARKLSVHVEALQEAMRRVAYWDLLIAKAYLAFEYNLVLPHLHSGNEFGYKALFHPMVKQMVEQQGGRYQCIDISMKPGACLLTGANMSGKTVLLKSLALAQCLLQFGFPVPAQEAHMLLFDSVELLVQDRQDEERGLSSFGAEMQQLNHVLQQLRQGTYMLLLVDELARTTNPDEGKAIVCAVLESLQQLPCVAMVSTHYGPIPNPVRRLRVRGFREDWMDNQGGASVLSHIQACMDYSVEEEAVGSNPPAEALRIAGLLGFDPEVLALAGRYYRERI